MHLARNPSNEAPSLPANHPICNSSPHATNIPDNPPICKRIPRNLTTELACDHSRGWHRTPQPSAEFDVGADNSPGDLGPSTLDPCPERQAFSANRIPPLHVTGCHASSASWPEPRRRRREACRASAESRVPSPVATQSRGAMLHRLPGLSRVEGCVKHDERATALKRSALSMVHRAIACLARSGSRHGTIVGSNSNPIHLSASSAISAVNCLSPAFPPNPGFSSCPLRVLVTFVVKNFAARTPAHHPDCIPCADFLKTQKS